MATPEGQAKAQAINNKIETEAHRIIDELERTQLRPIARNTYTCIIQCYDKAGTTESAQSLDYCSKQCQQTQQNVSNIMSQEINNFQNRLNRSMESCHDKARDLMIPGMENDARRMQKVEDTLLKCMSNTANEHIKLLQPLKQRVITQLKNISQTTK